MPGIEKLHLEDALEDSPQIRSLLGVFEEDITRLRKYASTLHNCCNRIMSAQNELTCATQALSSHMKAYENTKFLLDNDSDSILAVTMKQFANTIDEVSSWHQIMVAQFADGVMFPVAKFLEYDIKEVIAMGEHFQQSSSDLDKVLVKFSKLSKKKEIERERQEANEDVYMTQKKFHQVALNYYARLNALQYKRKTALIEPILGYLHALKSHYTLGYETLAVKEAEDFLTNIGASVQGVHSEFAIDTQKTVELIDSIEKQSQHLYHAEPTSTMPYIPANTSLVQKSGYLFQRTKMVGVVNRWDRVYFFTQGGNLMMMNKGEVAGCLAIELDNLVTVIAMDNEDRRNVFQVTNGKRSLVLQALNERERDEWMCTIQNVIRDGGYIKGKVPMTRTTSRTSQSSIEKLPAAISGSSPAPPKVLQEGEIRQSASSSASRGCGTNIEVLSRTPIVFDMISPTKADKQFSTKAGPPRRINPFTQSSCTLTVESLWQNSVFHEVCPVRFLGSMEVPYDRGDQLVHETMRHILAARAIHNVFKMTECHIVVTEEKLSLIDPSNLASKAEYLLHNVSYWATHRDNNRLVAFITRTNEEDGQSKFNCHVFESNTTGGEVCSILDTASKIAYQQLMEKEKLEQFRQKEKEILLHNIALQDDDAQAASVENCADGQTNGKDSDPNDESKA